MRRIVVGLLLMGVSWATPALAKETIKVGAILGVTGPAANLGGPEARTLEMLVQELNKKGGIKGNPVELIVKDSSASPEKAISFAKQLIDEDKVFAIIGPSTSGETMKIKTLAEDGKTILLSCAAAEAIVKPVGKYVFKTPQNDSHAVRKIYEQMHFRMSTFGFLFALSHCLPEAILALGVLALILVGALRERAELIITELAVGILGLALLSLFSGKANAVLFGGAFIDDGFGRFAKGLCYFASIVTLLIAHHFLVREKINKFEFPVLVLLSTLGMSMLISANGLIALYLGLELMSLALYVVAAFHRDDAQRLRGGPQIFRPRRIVVGHAALRRVAALRFRRHGLLRGHRRGGRAARLRSG